MKRILIILTILSLLATFTACGDTSDKNTDEAVNLGSVNVKDTITFGHYEQDDDASNGAEPIEWTVLAKESDRVLVISKYALDSLRYNEDVEAVTWETCTLREWLNNNFYQNAFNNSEKGKIKTVQVINSDNTTYGTDGGNTTEDKVFLLSIDEAGQYFDSDESRACKVTKHAKAQGTEVDMFNENCMWLLRSPALNSYSAAFVGIDGQISDYGNFVDIDERAVRPAMWISID